jgi:two-component system, NtrC family, sensor kinase
MRVLIAEDDHVSRLILLSTVRRWGFDPIVACDGAQALAAFEGEAPPQIAILDWMMPEVDGTEVCRRVREMPSVKSAYIILLTAKSQREDLIAGLTAGADDYVTKPFNGRELFARFQVGLRVAELQQNLSDRVQELEVAVTHLRYLQKRQKLEALGQIATGIADEINAPANCIGANLRFLQDSWKCAEPLIRAAARRPELDDLLKEVPRALESSLHEVAKVTSIAGAMKEFAVSPGEVRTALDLNQAIRTALTVTAGEWKHVAEVKTDLDPELPSVKCLPADIHQVLLNLVLNAAHAIGEAKGAKPDLGLLEIVTARRDQYAEIRISDTGPGIPENHQNRIFEPFFMTRDDAKGAGNGLATVYSVIKVEHRGKISFESKAGKGTTFTVHLPIDETAAETLTTH